MSCCFLNGTSGNEQPDEQQIPRVAQSLADFISGAQPSVQIAIYDFRLKADTAAIMLGAIRDTAARGVHKFIGFDAGTTPDNQETFSAQRGDLSTNATKNAENVVRVESSALGEAYASYVDSVIRRYSA